MKHYFGATPDGRLYWTFVRAGGYDGSTVDLEDQNPQDPHALHLLSVYNKNMKASETLDCVLVYECPCPPGGQEVCDCPSQKRITSYCNNGVLTDKPTCKLLIDGVDTTTGTTVTRYPNSLFTAQLVADDPNDFQDGEVAYLYSTQMLETGQATLTFNSGQTNTVTLRAPAQGSRGYLSVAGIRVCYYSLYVKGFSSTPS
jgi:hypothetical protein